MTKDIVEDFLSQFHQKMKIFRIIFRDDRGKNLQTLLDLEITPTQREDIIKQLEVEDYIDGPSDDTLNNIAPLWVFGKKSRTKTYTSKYPWDGQTPVLSAYHSI